MLIVILVTSNVSLTITAALVLLPVIIWLFGGANSLIFYTLALALFQALRYMPTARRGWANASSKKNFIVERRYKPWQTKKRE